MFFTAWLTQWLNTSVMHAFILEHSYVWPTLEIFHFIGLCLLFGSLLMVDLRVLGLAKKIPYQGVEPFIILTIIGFIINFVTGGLFIAGDPSRYFVNIAFQLKMLAVCLAFINALLFMTQLKAYEYEHPRSTLPYFDMPGRLKCLAGLSVLLWGAVLVLGRFIPYVE